jgi:hypothetical protein
MRPILKGALVTALALTVLAACAEVVKHREAVEARDREQYLRYAGTPIERYTSLVPNYSRWSLIGEGQIVAWTDYEHAYLLKVQLPCPELEFADSLGVTSSAHTVTSGFDSVVLPHQQCRILEIRPVDYPKLKKDVHAAP